jgi:hypothetical protein
MDWAKTRVSSKLQEAKDAYRRAVASRRIRDFLISHQPEMSYAAGYESFLKELNNEYMQAKRNRALDDLISKYWHQLASTCDSISYMQSGRGDPQEVTPEESMHIRHLAMLEVAREMNLAQLFAEADVKDAFFEHKFGGVKKRGKKSRRSRSRRSRSRGKKTRRSKSRRASRSRSRRHRSRSARSASRSRKNLLKRVCKALSRSRSRSRRSRSQRRR